jgi:uncharacterized membrane protein
MNNKTKQLVTMAVFIALSMIGAVIKINGSIALDALPAFLGSIMLGPVAGGIIGCIGHLMSAGFAGFYLSLPMHLLIAFEMLVIVAIFGKVYRDGNKVVAIVLGIVLNGPVATFLASQLASILGAEFAGMAMFYAFIVPLTIAAAVNVILASIVYEGIKKARKE